MNTVKERIVSILSEEIGIEVEKIGDDTPIGDLGADSLHCVEIVIALEEEFEIDIPDQVADTLMTLNDVLVYLDGRGIVDEKS